MARQYSNLRKINLQLFAEKEVDEIDEEIIGEEEELEEDPEDGEEPEEDPEEELEVDPEGDDPEKKQPFIKDKKTIAIIREKAANKELKAKLAEYERRDKEKELSEKKKQLTDKFISKGYDEEDAEKMAENDTKVEKLEREIKMLRYERQAEKLESKYPEVTDNLDKLIDICSKTGWSLEKVCLAEYGSSKIDQKNKSDQETLLKRKKVSKVPITGGSPIQSTKLDAEDERAYQIFLKKNPGISRKAYQENIISVHNQKIAHDKWD